MYKSVRELSAEQLDELRWNLYYPNEDEFSEDEEDLLNLCIMAKYDTDITDEMIFEHYGHISFVDDDFGCTAGNYKEEGE